MESATRNAVELQTREPKEQTVHKMGFPRKDFKRSSLCYRCEQDHPPDRCRFKKAVCRNCGKIGHIQRAWRADPKGDSTGVNHRLESGLNCGRPKQ